MAASAQQKTAIYLDGHLTWDLIFDDTLARNQWISEELVDLWSAGYLYSGLDSISNTGIYLHRGKRLKGEVSRMLVYNENPEGYETMDTLQGFKFKSFSSLLSRYTDSGYPFASVYLDSVFMVERDSYEVHITTIPGPKVAWDSISLASDINTNSSFLLGVLNIDPGLPYSEKIFREIPERIRRVSFLELNSRPDIGFVDDKARVYLDLKQNSTNSFEGIVGILPNQSPEDKIVITGYINLMLQNLFQSGKGLDFSWNRFANQSQSLNISYFHPYLFSSQMYLDAGFDLLRQDTLFLTQSWRIAIGSYLGNSLDLQVHYKNTNGSLIEPAISSVQAGFADFTSNRYSVSLSHDKFGSEFGLRSGISFSSSITIGDKNIKINPAVGTEAYDSMRRQTLLVGMRGAVDYQLMLGRQTGFNHQISGEALFNDEILNNELVRLGGLRTLRGFNENFFFAQHYGISRMEVRQYFERRSYFMLFYDQLIYSQYNDWNAPLGFGTGLALQTSNGLFSFAMALGTSREIPLDVSNMKIHLGYISRF